MAKGLRVPAVARAFLGTLVLLAAFAGAGLADPTFPPLTDRVVDDAGVLSAPIRAKLIAMLAEEERTTGNQLAIVTVKSLQGYSIEDYGYQLGRHWGIGQKDKNNGALLLVAPSEHKVRIEVGYGSKAFSPTRKAASSSSGRFFPPSGAAITIPACSPAPPRFSTCSAAWRRPGRAAPRPCRRRKAAPSAA